MMSQYNEFKKKYPDAILLFRVGDFYETFCEDAIEVSALLGITLTKRANGTAAHIDLAGFPHHALDTYLPKLVNKGKRVAICDQIEDPKLTKKLVKRDVTELVTPGLTTHDTVLDASTNNFLAALYVERGVAGATFMDLSTGEFLTTEGPIADTDKMLANFDPKEVLIRRGSESEIRRYFGDKLCLYPIEEWVFTEDYGRERLRKHFQVHHLKGFGIDRSPHSIITAGAILYYLEATKHSEIGHITTLRRLEEHAYLRLDRFTLRNLEILQPLSEDGVSLVQTLDHTATPMGGRMLKRWLVFPLLDVTVITERQRAVQALVESPDTTAEIGELLAGIGDLERLAGKVAVGRINPRELLQIAHAVRQIRPIMDIMSSTGAPALRDRIIDTTEAEVVANHIEQTIDPDTPIQTGRGNVIRRGVLQELDDLRDIAGGGKEYLLQMRQREIERTGISSLKIAFNNVFGYYIEVRNAHKDHVPADWIRKQTLVNAERYITPELKEYEQKILSAEEKIQILETELLTKLTSYVLEHIRLLQAHATALSELDVLHSFARTALQHHYCAPIVDNGDLLEITDGRHPVIEQLLPSGESYVPNDLHLDSDHCQIIIITGPNMSGKSALLRQTALITLMAQVGSFVPATTAHIGIIDHIFTRVGASDNISRGESTFMVEMTESASILNNLTPRSLVLIDELGRGTSTYDGISIARAIVEYLHDYPHGRAKTLFATHYHELNELEGHYPRIRNFNVSVHEEEGKVVFLRKLVPGGSEHSFGIHVARMAGMPRAIVERAEELLTILEAHSRGTETEETTPHSYAPQTEPSIPATAIPHKPIQLSFFEATDPQLTQLRDQIRALDIESLTPLQALNTLHQLQLQISDTTTD